MGTFEEAVTEQLLLRASKRKVASVLPDLFLDYPTPEALANAREKELRDLLFPLGSSRTHARDLIALAQNYTALGKGCGGEIAPT